jgi:protein involved in polysaccharide export with SLBB domain
MHNVSRGKCRQDRWRPVAWLALTAMMLNPVLAMGAAAGGPKAVLGPGDEVQLTVPGRSDLDQTVVLDAAGQAKVVPVGPVQLGGLSVADATALLKQKLRLFYPHLDALHLKMARAGTVRIYIIGSVSQKGALNFDAPPSLWDVLRSIGGPLESANLRDARVIREENGVPQVTPLDLSGVMEGGEVPAFVLQNGDTLVIPSLREGIPGVKAHNGVKVFGGVRVPTIVPIEEGTRLMEVLMLAGAPSEVAAISKIHWVHEEGDRHRATVIDLKRFLLDGDEAGNPLVYPGDTVNVEFSRPGWIRQNIPITLASLAALATIWLAYDNINNQPN